MAREVVFSLREGHVDPEIAKREFVADYGHEPKQVIVTGGGIVLGPLTPDDIRRHDAGELGPERRVRDRR